MFGKILLCIYFMGATQAVFIDPAENREKDFDKVDSHGWQLIKVYHPPKPRAFGFKHEPYAYPKYEFEYSVSDKKTGDHKHHHEERDGDRVRGEYSLVESDGSLRKVQYHADDHSGFNAVVSKTVNKHGDNAFSVTDHTRYFYPIGHGIKINHYFPGKNYHYQEMEKPENYKESAPVYEEKDSGMAKNEESQMVVIDAEDKTKGMLLEPEQAKEEPTPMNEVEIAPVKVIPAVVTMIANNPEESKVNSENSIIAVENTKSVPTMEMPSPVEDQHNIIEKDDQSSDSEVASSYYRSKMYYVAY